MHDKPKMGVLSKNATASAVAAGSANGTDVYTREVQEDAAKKAKGGVRRARRGRGRKARRGRKLRRAARLPLARRKTLRRPVPPSLLSGSSM